MEQQMYCIFDRVAEDVVVLFEAKNDGVAMRQFKGFLEKHPVKADEFRLYQVGLWMPSTMALSGSTPREVFSSGIELVKEA